MSQRIDCPICHAVNDVDDSSVGCYVPCQRCQARFYVTVPPLEGTPAAAIRAEPTATPTAGAHASQSVVRQESLLWTIAQEMSALRRILITFAVVTSVCFVVLTAALIFLATRH